MIVIAAYIAGLFLVLREAVPWLKARASGVIYTRGHRRHKVLRAEEPERFAALAANRFRAIGVGALVLALAVGWTVWTLFGAVLQAAAPL
ncbi:hypothetical protein GCM10017620_22250 [Brevundimonas intermedia]|uniref:Uncharacterized protein n=1 Tax=Brevundimonas intermedia TaxID=74315 RepID=A0ABQ5T8Z9_9CAUL|nr:hypothetical protein [Brevundimonas intermedia]GLK49252.1 hypothetical protein GCM10017620_22250 [Brevundimonas intermedia]